MSSLSRNCLRVKNLITDFFQQIVIGRQQSIKMIHWMNLVELRLRFGFASQLQQRHDKIDLTGER